MKFTLPEAHLIPPAFSDEVMDEAEDLVKVPRHELTKDLVHLTTAEHPTALDCSFGIHLSPGTEEGASQALGVSVVDTSIIDPKGKIAEEVLRRGGKCFTGKRSVPMLPDYLVEGRLSFAYESDQGPPVRDSITAEIDSGESSAEEGKASQEGLIWTPFKKTAATVLAALTYAEADEDVKDDDAREAPVLRRLQQIIEFARKTSQLGLAGVQSTRRKVRSRWAKTQLAMQMLRFMFNDAAMRFAEEHGIPILYTNQRANPRNDTEKNLVELYEADPERVKNQRAVRTAWRALGIEDSWSVKPLGHFFMQRERFAEFDSPLNNAVAFVNVANLGAALRGEQPRYSKKFLRNLGPYLGKARKERSIYLAGLREKQRGEKPADVKEVNLEALSIGDFRALIAALALSGEIPPKEFIDELCYRIEEGEFERPYAVANLALGPRPGQPGWIDAQGHCSQWIKEESGRGEWLLRASHSPEFPHWEETRTELLDCGDSWQAWVAAKINGKWFTSPSRIQIATPRAALRRSVSYFWESYFAGGLKQGEDPGSDNVKVLPYHSKIPKHIKISKEVPERVHPAAACILHVICFFYGLLPPRVRRIIENAKNGDLRYKSLIHGIRGIEPKVAPVPDSTPGRATRRTAGYVLADIANRFGVSEVPPEALAEARRSIWTKRKKMKMAFKRPRFKDQLSYGPLADLKSFCRCNGLAEPLVEDGKQGRQKVSVTIGQHTITKNSNAWPDSEYEARDLAAQRVMKQIPKYTQPTDEYAAIQNDKRDCKTPLGLLYALAEEAGRDLPRLEISIRKDDKRSSVFCVQVSYPFVADSIPEESEHKSCLRVAANQAALKILQRYKESAAACDRLKRSTLPELPAVIDESRDIPVGYLLQTDPMREVAFYCREQGHSEPEFKASVVAQGKKGKKNLLEYTCTVTTRDGDKLTTVASSLDRSKPMPISAARMLKILRPQLRSERLYTTKIELLEKVPDTGFEFEAIEHQPLPKEERGGGHKVMSTRVVRFESTEFTEESIGYTSRHGADKVNGLALERLRHARRRAIQKKFREQRRKKRNQNSS